MNNQTYTTLWTFQHPSLFEEVMRNGVACCRKKSYMWDEEPCATAYKWMARQMYERVGNPEMPEAFAPIWAWHSWKGKDHRKPRREIEHFADDDNELVYMELEIPSNRILVSDFMLWHYPLNGWIIGDDESVPIESTWYKMFDPTFTDEDWVKPCWEDRCLQATFWCLHKENIVYADLLQRQEERIKLKVKRLYEKKPR